MIQRLLANLTGEGPKYPNLSEDAVIVSTDLLPSTIAELNLNHVKAIATDAGGWTSHMAIIARGLGLPLLSDCVTSISARVPAIGSLSMRGVVKWSCIRRKKLSRSISSRAHGAVLARRAPSSADLLRLSTVSRSRCARTSNCRRSFRRCVISARVAWDCFVPSFSCRARD